MSFWCFGASSTVAEEPQRKSSSGKSLSDDRADFELSVNVKDLLQQQPSRSILKKDLPSREAHAIREAGTQHAGTDAAQAAPGQDAGALAGSANLAHPALQTVRTLNKGVSFSLGDGRSGRGYGAGACSGDGSASGVDDASSSSVVGDSPLGAPSGKKARGVTIAGADGSMTRMGSTNSIGGSQLASALASPQLSPRQGIGTPLQQRLSSFSGRVSGGNAPPPMPSLALPPAGGGGYSSAHPGVLSSLSSLSPRGSSGSSFTGGQPLIRGSSSSFTTGLYARGSASSVGVKGSGSSFTAAPTSGAAAAPPMMASRSMGSMQRQRSFSFHERAAMNAARKQAGSGVAP